MRVALPGVAVAVRWRSRPVGRQLCWFVAKLRGVELQLPCEVVACPAQHLGLARQALRLDEPAHHQLLFRRDIQRAAAHGWVKVVAVCIP